MFSLLCLIGGFCHAQTPVKIWDKTIGGNHIDRLSSITATTDGGFILSGSSYSDISGDKTETRIGGFDYWVVKINSAGQKIWDKTFGGNSNDFLISTVLTSDGGYILGGYSISGVSGDKSENTKGNYDYWVVKINSSGQKVWDKTFGGGQADYFTSLSLTSDGGYILGGYSMSAVSGDKTDNNKGGYDYWVIKINSLGQKVWDKTFGGNGSDELSSIISTTDGAFILAGSSSSNSSVDKTENNIGYEDYWVLKVNSLGQKVWDKTIGGSGGDVLSNIITTSDEGYLLAGRSYSNISADKTENCKGSWDYWIVKINAAREKVWDKTLGGNSFDHLNSIISIADSKYILAGYSGSNISGDKTENNKGGNDFWLVKIDDLAQKVWDKTIGANGGEESAYIVSISNGEYYITGYSASDASGDKTENGKGNYDYWLVKLTELCPNFSSAPPNVSITNSTCSTNCTLTNGSITAPTNACPAGSSTEYSTNNGVSWSTTLPVYNQTTPVSIQIRCKCLSDTTVVSTASVAVTTSPATCQLPNAPISGGNQSVFATNPIQTLTATATAPAGSTVKWYDAASADNTVANPTWNVIGTKNYFAASKDNNTNCESATRTSVTLEIKARLSSDYVEFGVNNTHDPNTIFEVHSSNKGILFPRIDFNNRPTTNLTSGLLIYVILNGPQGNNCFYYWNGTSWVKLGNS